MAETSTSYTYQMPPEYIQQRQQELLNTLFGVGKKKGLIEQPLDVVAQQVAGFSPAQLQAFQMAQQGIGSYEPYLQQATSATQGALGAAQGMQQASQMAEQGALSAGQGMQQASQMAGQAGQATTPVNLGAAYGATAAGMGQYQPTQAALSGFMDPYQQNVTQEALKEIRRQADIGKQGQAAQAIQAGAFGGGREGVVRAETERGVQDVMSRRIFEDLSRNYQQALGASQASQEAAARRAIEAGKQFGQLGLGEAGIAQADLARQLQAAGLMGSLAGQEGQLGLQTAGLMGSLAGQEGQLGLQVGQQLGALGTTAQAQQLQDVQTMLGIGGQQQQLAQAQLEAQRQNLLAQQMEPYRRYSYGLEALAGLPFGGTTIQQQQVPTANPFLQAAGAIGTLGYGIGSLLG